MQCRRVINNLLGKKNLNLLLNEKLPFVDNQTLLQTTRCFASSSRQSSHLKSSFQYKRLAVLHCGGCCREFSSSRAVFAQEGSNRSKQEKQIRRLSFVLTLVVAVCMVATYMIEEHQDHVIIEPEKEK